jgi:hypothetical protein
MSWSKGMRFLHNTGVFDRWEDMAVNAYCCHMSLLMCSFKRFWFCTQSLVVLVPLLNNVRYVRVTRILRSSDCLGSQETSKMGREAGTCLWLLQKEWGKGKWQSLPETKDRSICCEWVVRSGLSFMPHIKKFIGSLVLWSGGTEIFASEAIFEF